MKNLTQRMKLTLLLVPLFSVNATAALTHGSIKGSGLTLYDQGSAGGNTEGATKVPTLDFKVVTIGSKTWGWEKANGSYIETGADWVSQLRFWSSANAKTENNMLNRDATNNLATEVWGKTSNSLPSPANLSFFNVMVTGGYSETALIPYDPTAKNSAVVGDITPPVITSCATSDIAEISAKINITGSDDASDLFYYITGDGIEEVSFRPTISLTGLSANTTYNLTVTPIDFSGNEGTPESVSFTTGGLVQITSGIAKDIKFVFKSTETQFEYYYEFTDPTKKFRDAFIKITPSGDTEFEIKPTLSPDSTYVYGVSTDSRLANKILTLNCGYFIYVPGDPIWENYVVDNKVITEGTLNGISIKHQMGAGPSMGETETVTPILNNVSLEDVTSKYIKLHIDGNDNSGTVYYEITGGKQAINAFRTGDYYITDIEPGKNYTLNIVAKDLSGNYSAGIEVQAKTIKSRSNIVDNIGMNYNTTTTTTAGGELVSIIQQTGNSLTLGCTTASNVIQDAGYLNRIFNTPTVKINGTDYPLTIDANKTTATATFTGQIGEIPIEDGSSFEICWSVFWGETGGGNFVTGTYTYKIGDTGQTDTEGPSAPELSLTGNTLSWNACTDLLSGVKWYEVNEAGQATLRIFDLGETSFSYNLIDANNQISVTALDFAGNFSETSTVNVYVSNKITLKDKNIVYQDPITKQIFISGVKNTNIDLFTIEGKLVKSAVNTNTINVSTLAKGLYIVLYTNEDGMRCPVKVEVR